MDSWSGYSVDQATEWFCLKTREKYKYMKYLETVISKVSSYTAIKTEPTSLGEFLLDTTYQDDVARIREMSDKADRDIAKAMLPAALISCRTESRASDSPFEHTGLICLDIDGKHNPLITDWAQFVTGELPKLDVIVFAGLSVSGNGCFAVIPIANPDNHQGHFKALEADFKKCGVTIDTAGKSPKNLRGYSYNDDATGFCNEDAKRYSRIEASKVQQPAYFPCSRDEKKVKEAVDRVVARRVDLTGNYEDWARAAQSLATAFGERGRYWFHQLSQFHPEYNADRADKKYTSFLGRGYSQVGLGTFFRLCSGVRNP
jgi:hypothetical protein